MCFAPQLLMVMGALISSMGGAVLLSKYADCSQGIMGKQKQAPSITT